MHIWFKLIPKGPPAPVTVWLQPQEPQTKAVYAVCHWSFLLHLLQLMNLHRLTIIIGVYGLLRAHSWCCTFYQFSSVQSLSRVQLFATPWTAARQASLSITSSQSPPMGLYKCTVVCIHHYMIIQSSFRTLKLPCALAMYPSLLLPPDVFIVSIIFALSGMS